jgi:hypothetical protein
MRCTDAGAPPHPAFSHLSAFPVLFRKSRDPDAPALGITVLPARLPKCLAFSGKSPEKTRDVKKT